MQMMAISLEYHSVRVSMLVRHVSTVSFPLLLMASRASLAASRTNLERIKQNQIS